MTVHAYNSHCGWKYNLLQKKNGNLHSMFHFILSLVTALIIVFIVAQILAAIDLRLQKNTNFYSGLNPFQVSKVYAASVNNGDIVIQEGTNDLYYIGPKSGKLHFLSDATIFKSIITNFSKTITKKDLTLIQNKKTSLYKGAFVIVKDDYFKLYYIKNSFEPILISSTKDPIGSLTSSAKIITAKDIAKYSVASAFAKPKNHISSTSGAVASSSTAQNSNNGVDVVKYCADKSFANPKSDLERTCNTMKAERDKKIAYYDKINNPSKYVAPAPVVTTPKPTTTPVVVTSNPTTPTVTNPTTVVTPVVATGLGPLMRVGIFASPDSQMVRATHAFNITDSSGNSLLALQPNQTAVIDYNESSGTYAYGAGALTNTSSGYIRLVPSNTDAVFEVTTFESRPAWNTSLNDNLFLGTLELRYNNSKKRTWVINELPMESYLKGIAETSNISPMEYQKALLTAARTYATYHLVQNTKHADEYFTVDATYDQVYKGYGAQKRLSNVSVAVDATRGQIVTYNNAIAITPFFSWSDGRTRSMKEVWGADKPWLQSVAEPLGYTKTTLYGHGVGLSAYGALLLASDKYNYSYDRILQYYYQGTTLTANYNNQVKMATSP